MAYERQMRLKGASFGLWTNYLRTWNRSFARASSCLICSPGASVNFAWHSSCLSFCSLWGSWSLDCSQSCALSSPTASHKLKANYGIVLQCSREGKALKCESLATTRAIPAFWPALFWSDPSVSLIWFIRCWDALEVSNSVHSLADFLDWQSWVVGLSSAN